MFENNLLKLITNVLGRRLLKAYLFTLPSKIVNACKHCETSKVSNCFSDQKFWRQMCFSPHGKGIIEQRLTALNTP
jgi:hypothetical protein